MWTLKAKRDNHTSPTGGNFNFSAAAPTTEHVRLKCLCDSATFRLSECPLSTEPNVFGGDRIAT